MAPAGRFVVWLLKAAGRYEARGTFRSYLFGVAFRVLSDARRSDKPDRAIELVDDPAAPTADPDDVLWVRQALLELDPIDRDVLMLREYEQLSYDDIAAVLEVPVNTVRSRLFRARAALRERLLGHAELRKAQ